jgi:hypothetical protein
VYEIDDARHPSAIRGVAGLKIGISEKQTGRRLIFSLILRSPVSAVNPAGSKTGHLHQSFATLSK